MRIIPRLAERRQIDEATAWKIAFADPLDRVWFVLEWQHTKRAILPLSIGFGTVCFQQSLRQQRIDEA